nr:S41 family peptidase [uncultured Flavobacterium sp.]
MRNIYIILCSFLLVISFANAQSNQLKVNLEEQKLVVKVIDSLLNSNYVFPNVAKTMTNSLSDNLNKGEYNLITDPILFSERLTIDLQSISKDKHVKVQLNPKYIKEVNALNSQQNNKDDFPISLLETWKMNNYGFKEVKILEGNIGYIDLRNFSRPEFAAETAVAAMNFVSNSNAIIFDLRKNGGGSPQMIQLITSYLFGADPVHLNDFYFRPRNEIMQTWTLPYISGKRSVDVPVYVLTSNTTFSAAEEFAYNLKSLKRATIIGEVTGGGANPGGDQIINDRFVIFIPFGRAINPITNTNWEETGVQPDIKVPAIEALSVAQQKILENLSVIDSINPNSIYSWLLSEHKLKQNSLTLTDKQLKEYQGAFGTKTVTVENGQLLYPYSLMRKAILIPLGNDLFKVEDTLLRVQFIRKVRKISSIQVENVNGNIEEYLKN